ncbi:MAG: NAD(P)-binding protein [Anaerolineales bacterium]|nr:MAG: NAD(P)-binding protein [Anaerolineales bacterium]
MGKEIKIAGAGPAGLAAAIVLARAGHPVSVFEQRANVGGRFNDDFQGIESWSTDIDPLEEFHQLGIATNWWLRPFHGGQMFSPDFRNAEIETKKILFYLVRRGDKHPDSLDTALFEQAKGFGVRFVFNRRLSQSEADIWAAGPSGPPKAVAAGITFAKEGDDFACVLLSEELAPSGYVYYLVSGGQATLATVLYSNFSFVHQALKNTKKHIARLFGLTRFPQEKQWGGYGGFSIPKSCYRNGVLHVGEAAGFQDLLFGFGIRSALISGALAAKSILLNTDYDYLWQQRLLPQLRASTVNRLLYGSFGDLPKNIFWQAAKRGNAWGFMRWLYSYSLPHRLIFSCLPKALYSVEA